jgi:thiosulfate reductase cytochrome b subunit
MKLVKLYLFTRFERIWHWLQMLLIFVLLITGFEVHGLYTLFGFERAVELHGFFGISWCILVAFIIFWMAITAEWKQYLPTTKKLFAVARYYLIGIFIGEESPVHQSQESKHNPLQRIIYLSLVSSVLPLQIITGLLYWTYNDWKGWGLAGFLDLKIVATIHLVLAIYLIHFIIIHVYMTTTGHTPMAHIKAMLSGYEEVPEDSKEQ